MQALEKKLRVLEDLNHRHEHLFRTPHATQITGTVESHRMSHNVVRQTGRTDLMIWYLAIADMEKVRRTQYFTPCRIWKRNPIHGVTRVNPSVGSPALL